MSLAPDNSSGGRTGNGSANRSDGRTVSIYVPEAGGETANGNANGNAKGKGKAAADAGRIGIGARPGARAAASRGGASSARARMASRASLLGYGRGTMKGGTGTVFSSTANLANTVIGAGLVAMPGAMKYTGLIPGVLLIVFCGFTSVSGLYLLTRCAAKIGGRETSFYSVATKTLPRWARLIDLAIALKCYGVSISYLLISGQLMPQVMISLFKALGKDPHEIPELYLNRDLWILIFMILLTPLCFLRRLDSLRHTSYLSLLAVTYLVLIVLYYSFLDHAKSSLPPRGAVELVRFDRHLVSIFPVYVFAFTCAQNVFPVYNELARNSETRVNAVIASAIGASGIVYELTSICGYLTFGSNVTDNILSSYPATSLFVAGGRLAIVILTLFSYPLQVHPCRAAFDKVFTLQKPANAGLTSVAGTSVNGAAAGSRPTSYTAVPQPGGEAYRDEVDAADAHANGKQRAEADTSAAASDAGDVTRVEHDDDDEDEDEDEDEAPLPLRPYEMSLRRWCVLTGVILSTTFLISMVIDDLSIILGFVGSVGSTTISFILPGVLYSVLYREDAQWERELELAEEQEDDGEDEDEEEDEEDEAAEDEEEEELQARRQPSWQSKSSAASKRSVVKLNGRGPIQRMRRFAIALAIYGVVVLVFTFTANVLKVINAPSRGGASNDAAAGGKSAGGAAGGAAGIAHKGSDRVQALVSSVVMQESAASAAASSRTAAAAAAASAAAASSSMASASAAAAASSSGASAAATSIWSAASSGSTSSGSSSSKSRSAVAGGGLAAPALPTATLPALLDGVTYLAPAK